LHSAQRASAVVELYPLGHKAAVSASPKRIAAISLLASGVLIALAVLSAEPNAHVAVRLIMVTNSIRGPAAVLQFRNDGDATVRLDPYGTLYWKDRFGNATNSFFRQEVGSAILQPGKVVEGLVLSPSDTDVWQSSFSYTVQPGFLKRAFSRFRFWMPGRWVPDNSFFGRFAPVVTNSAASASADGVFLNTESRN
jgi:hypothetical protein